MAMKQADRRAFARETCHKKGLAAENLAERFLEAKRYQILARRYRNRAGEIDLIAKRGEHLAFIEVKGRKTHEDAAWSVLPRQQARIALAAECFLDEHREFSECSASFDVVLVSPTEGLAHIEQAFLA
jgi:putative endonuclease